MKKTESLNPINITFRDISYSVKTGHQQKPILKNISGICKSGEVTAILGSSGAGKTSLLNCLCKRLSFSQNTYLSGTTLANSMEYSSDSFNDFAAYVMQDDILLETLTVRECIQFAADFKVNGTEQEKNIKVNQILKKLQLERCRNSLIGGRFLKGISGGERKRTSIGFEMINDPSVIFLDEHTSGLDSFTAFILVNELREFAHNMCKTVVFTIHQPSSDIWNMFDRIILMINGEIMYQGQGKQEILDYFSRNGFKCPLSSNPGDYLLSIMHSDKEVNRDNFSNYVKFYSEQLKNKVDLEIQSAPSFSIEKRQQFLGISQQIKLILKRTFKVNFRNPILFKSRFVQSVIMALYIGAIWWQLTDGRNDPYNDRDLQNRSGLLYFFTVSVFMGSVNPCVLTFPVDKQIFLREQNSRLYGQFPYFFAKIIVDILTNIQLPILDTLIGLRLEVEAVFFFLIIMIMMSLIGVSVGYLVGTLFKNANSAMSLMPLIVFPLWLFSGFYKNRGDFSNWIGWIEYISPFKYGFQALCLNEYEETYFIPNPLNKYNFEFVKGEALGLMVVYFVFVTTLSFTLLYFFKKKLQ